MPAVHASRQKPARRRVINTEQLLGPRNEATTVCIVGKKKIASEFRLCVYAMCCCFVENTHATFPGMAAIPQAAERHLMARTKKQIKA